MTDQEFLDYLDVRYNQFLRFVLGHVGHRQAAEDILQETLLMLWNRRDGINAASPHGYFFRSLYHGIVNSWRAQGRQPLATLPEEDLPDRRAHDPTSNDPNPGEDSLAAALQECAGAGPEGPGEEVLGAVEGACTQVFCDLHAEMSPIRRSVLAAFLQARGSQSEALTRLDLPTPSTYPNELHKAKNQFREVLAPHEETLVRILGAPRLLELLSAVFCPEGPSSEEQP